MNQNEDLIKKEIAKLAFANFFYHIIGIIEMYYGAHSLATGNVTGMIVGFGFALYVSYALTKRQFVVRSLLELLDKEEKK